MLSGLYSAATALNAAEKNQEVIAHNLAHHNVPGYRRSVVAFETFEDLVTATENETGLGTEVAEVGVDFSEGPKVEGKSLDVAIDGSGFLVLAGPDGPLYTRNGVFHLDSDGQLVNAEGLLVEGTTGPITLPDGNVASQIQIQRDGSVNVKTRDGLTPLGQLRLVAFEDNRQLVPVGSTSFAAPDGVEPTDSTAQVHQGMRELSNVRAVDELVRMIVGLRQYEAAQRSLKTISEAVGQQTDPRA